MTDQLESRSSEREPANLPMEARQHFDQACAYEAQGEFENALRQCDLAIQLAPAWAEPHNLRGIALDELGRKEEAISAYRKAVRLDPTLSEAQDSLAEAESELKKENLEEIERLGKQVHRPGWVIVCAILIALVSLMWIWSGANALSDMSQIDWTASAARLEVDAGFLKGLYTAESYLLLASGVILLVADVGIWTMKKWGTVVYLVIVALLTLGQVFAVSQSQVDLGQLVFMASLIAIGVSLIKLWRDGELT
jgi:tetratricopeptide (TPR) repeat protein